MDIVVVVVVVMVVFSVLFFFFLSLFLLETVSSRCAPQAFVCATGSVEFSEPGGQGIQTGDLSTARWGR